MISIVGYFMYREARVYDSRQLSKEWRNKLWGMVPDHMRDNHIVVIFDCPNGTIPIRFSDAEAYAGKDMQSLKVERW